MKAPLAVLVMSIVSATVASAVEVILSTPGTDGWRSLEFPKVKRLTAYSVVREDGTAALKAQSDCSASAIYLPLESVDLNTTPRLHWRWKIERGLQVSDEQVKSGDDFAARVYVMFRFDPEHASLWDRARHSVATKLYGDIVPGDVISYVWTSHQSKGSAWNSPYESRSKLVSLGSGLLLPWTGETVDVAADYVTFFGHQPPPLLALAVMTDSDNTCQQAVAYYADFRFVSR